MYVSVEYIIAFERQRNLFLHWQQFEQLCHVTLIAEVFSSDKLFDLCIEICRPMEDLVLFCQYSGNFWSTIFT